MFYTLQLPTGPPSMQHSSTSNTHTSSPPPIPPCPQGHPISTNGVPSSPELRGRAILSRPEHRGHRRPGAAPMGAQSPRRHVAPSDAGRVADQRDCRLGGALRGGLCPGGDPPDVAQGDPLRARGRHGGIQRDRSVLHPRYVRRERAHRHGAHPLHGGGQTGGGPARADGSGQPCVREAPRDARRPPGWGGRRGGSRGGRQTEPCCCARRG